MKNINMIVYREYLQEGASTASVLEARHNRLGLSGLMEKLKQHKWADNKDGALVAMDIEFYGRYDAKESKHYIEWKATKK